MLMLFIFCFGFSLPHFTPPICLLRALPFRLDRLITHRLVRGSRDVRNCRRTGKKGKTWGWKKKHTRFNVLFFNVLDPLILKGFKVGMSLWAMYGSQYLRFAFNSQCKIFEAYISIINYGDGEDQHCHGWIEWILFRRSCVRCKSSPEQIFDDHVFLFPQDRTVHFS